MLPTPDKCRQAVAVAIVIGVAAMHLLRLGAHLRGSAYRLYYSYASDLLLPLAMYFLLCASEAKLPWVRDWRIKASAVFAVASIAEVLQGLGVPVLGSTFDPADFVMYGAGVLIAVVLDRIALPILCRAAAVRSGERSVR